MGGDILEFAPGCRINGLAIEDGVGAAGSRGELEEQGRTGRPDGMEMKVAEGVAGVGAGQEFLAVGKPVKIGVAIGAVATFARERVKIVGELPGIRESVAVGVTERWGIGLAWRRGCGVPVEGFVTELMADDALDGVARGLGVGGPWDGVGVVDFVGEDIGDEAKFRAWGGLGSVRHEQTDGFAAVIEAAVEGAEDRDGGGELVASAEGMKVVEIQGGVEPDDDEEAVRWEGGMGWKIEADGAAESPGEVGEFRVEEGDRIGGGVVEFDELIARVVFGA